MKTASTGAKQPRPERPKTVIIMDGADAVFIGYADAAAEKKIMEILMERRRIFAS